MPGFKVYNYTPDRGGFKYRHFDELKFALLDVTLRMSDPCDKYCIIGFEFPDGITTISTSDMKRFSEVVNSYYATQYGNDDLGTAYMVRRIEGIANQVKQEEEGSVTQKKDAINPTHYKDVVPGMQYMEMMQYMLARFSGITAHAMGHLYKYLMRAGKKDELLQDLEKAKWYLDFLIAYLKNKEDPIVIANIQKILAEKD